MKDFLKGSILTDMCLLYNIWTVTLCALLLRLGHASPIPSLEEPRSFLEELVDPSVTEQVEDVDVQILLNQLIHLNVTQQPKPRTARDEPPEYMRELYEHYASDHGSRPAANIIRSFKNEDSSPYIVTNRGVRMHPLKFNFYFPHQEHVIVAELRLYMLVHRDPRDHHSIDWKMTVFEVQDEEGSLFGQNAEGGRTENNLIGMQKLAARRGHRKENGWEVFDLTDAVRRWSASQNMSHMLELHVESVNGANQESLMRDKDQGDGAILINIDIERNSGGKHEPVLIVFSDKQNEEETQPGLMSPQDNGLSDLQLSEDGNGDGERQQDEALFMQLRSNVIYDNAPRTRRHAKANPCRRTALYVDFKEIGWDSWIFTPPGYEAYTCQGECSYPLRPQLTPTKHAIIQTLVNLKSSQRVSRACCVPTKLEPISLLYENENGQVVYQHKYEGMVVAECGCR